MSDQFNLPDDLHFNLGLITDPSAYFKQSGCVSWLSLTGEEFAAMENGMSFQQVQEATPHNANVVSDPPRNLNLGLAEQHVKALDELPRPTLISCRVGPRASAVAYMYSGLKMGADPEEVLAAAVRANAPFIKWEEYKDWVRTSIVTLRENQAGG